jgi:hypothetical protein
LEFFDGVRCLEAVTLNGYIINHFHRLHQTTLGKRRKEDEVRGRRKEERGRRRQGKGIRIAFKGFVSNRIQPCSA